MDRRVSGHCPMGCGETLFVGEGGHITCSFIRCPNPGAVARILRDPETEHRVLFSETSFIVTHPLRERLDGGLAKCELHRWLTERGGPPVRPGVYRATLARGDWQFSGVAS